jgi:hypothetical protein
MSDDTLKVVFEYPMYEDMMIRNGGNLSDIDKRPHACMHYYLLCQKLLEKAGHSTQDQIVYEGMAWTDKPYANIAIGTAIRYGLGDPGEFLTETCKHAVEQECVRQGFPDPDNEYWSVQPGTIVRV